LNSPRLDRLLRFFRATDAAPSVPPLRVERGAFRSLARAFAASAAALLALKTTIGDVTSVSSGSMSPTILGEDVGADAIVLDRTAYWFAEPKRWEPIFFRYVNNRRTTFLKRIVGLPGERISIYDGDVWIVDPDCDLPTYDAIAAGFARRAERSDASTRAAFALRPVLPESAVGAFGADAFDRYFAVDPERRAAFVALPTGGMRCVVDDGPPAEARLKEFVVDRPPGALEDVRVRIGGADGAEPVSDVGVEIDVALEDGAEAFVRLVCPRGGGAYRAALRSGDGAVELLLEGAADGAVRRATLERSKAPFARLRLERQDGGVAAFVDGRRLLEGRCPNPPNLPEPEREAPSSEPASDGARVAFGVARGRAAFRAPRVDRDVHYSATDQSRFLVPTGSYLCLGDRPGDSADARRWRAVVVEDLVSGVVYEGDMDGVRPETGRSFGRNPIRTEDGRDVFVDRLDREFALPEARRWRVLGTYRTPYVRREDVVGRASLIVWPLHRAGPPR
jgi:signal peptidase I